LVDVTSFAPRAMMTPFFTTTAPKGPPLPLSTFSMESRMASRMNSFFGSCMKTK
jgi:hypothetical protein